MVGKPSGTSVLHAVGGRIGYCHADSQELCRAGAGSPMSCWGSRCSGAEALKDEDKELITCYILFEDNTFY